MTLHDEPAEIRLPSRSCGSINSTRATAATAATDAIDQVFADATDADWRRDKPHAKDAQDPESGAAEATAELADSLRGQLKALETQRNDLARLLEKLT